MGSLFLLCSKKNLYVLVKKVPKKAEWNMCTHENDESETNSEMQSPTRIVW